MHKPTVVSIKERYRLNHTSSQKETFHIVLDISQPAIEYGVGDCVGVYPTNHPQLVERFLKLLHASGDEPVIDRQGDTHRLSYYLTHHANLVKLKKTICFDTPQTCVEHLLPLMPRFYSIASSMDEVGKELHLTVARTEFEVDGEKKWGTCSDFLCYRAPKNLPVIPIYIQKAKEFTLPLESRDKPIIMVGPGTGIAPFRGFMQERVKKAPHSKNWLFFGERNRASDFYYESYWKSLVNEGTLRLDTAFSRDQEHKIYVQHKMLEQSQDVWKWLKDGAYFYVCGDATRMAKDVENTLIKIVEIEGKMDPLQAREFIKNLRKEKKYLRDVY